jgi:phosphate/sulfate permease
LSEEEKAAEEAVTAEQTVGLANLPRFFITYAVEERVFLAVLGFLFLFIGFIYEDAFIARWVGFAIAGYSAVANDSIQTIGTFIAANEKRPWWLLWLFIGGIFVATVAYSWATYGGDVSYERLRAKGFENAPETFSYLQVAAPLFLLVLTRLKMPVSTTFLLLSSFAASGSSVGAVLGKSLSGYLLAFVLSIVLWAIVAKKLEQWFEGEAHAAWLPLQWISSGFLWSVWIMQDAANIAVYLPRAMSFAEMAVFAGVIFFGLGILFRMRGEKVQEVVNEKSAIVDLRSATLINLVFGGILYYFKIVSKVPMSTTWVFIGLLGGRELAMALRGTSSRDVRGTLRILGKDLLLVTIGLLVSLVLALAVNDAVRRDMLSSIGM